MQVDIRIIETIIVTLACILKSYQGENLATSDTSKKKNLRNLKCRDILISHLEYEVILINCLKSDRENIYLFGNKWKMLHRHSFVDNCAHTICGKWEFLHLCLFKTIGIYKWNVLQNCFWVLFSPYKIIWYLPSHNSTGKQTQEYM